LVGRKSEIVEMAMISMVTEWSNMEEDVGQKLLKMVIEVGEDHN
jgi:hypothetical protein